MLYDSMRILDAKTKGISWLEHESCQGFKEARNELKLKEVIRSVFVLCFVELQTGKENMVGRGLR